MVGVLGALDGNIVGLGSIGGCLVVALGYMLHDRRDSDTRVDKANAAVIAAAHAERDRALKAERQARHDLAIKQDELADALERNRILQFRLQIAEMKGGSS